MIGIQNSYEFSFDLNDKKDFIRKEDFLSFILISEAGNVLPTFSLEFMTSDSTILKYLNEGNSLVVSFGKNKTKKHFSKLLPKGKPSVIKLNDYKFSIKIVGIYNAADYMLSKQRIISQTTSVNALKTIALELFKEFNTNIDFLIDKQTWIQPLTLSTRNFVQHIWEHSYIDNSIPSLAITSDGVFRYFDLRKKIKTINWYLTDNPEKDKDIYFANKSSIIGQNTILYNSTDSLDLNSITENLDQNTSYSEDVIGTTLLSVNSTLERRSTIEKQIKSNVTTSFTHNKFWTAKLKNIQGLLNLSAFKFVVPLSAFNEIEPLDIIYIRDYKNKIVSKLNELTSGTYICTKSIKQLTIDNYTSIIELCRENINNNQV